MDICGFVGISGRDEPPVLLLPAATAAKLDLVIQSDRGASAQRRRTQEGSATRPEAWERKPTAEAVLRRLRRRADGITAGHQAKAGELDLVQPVRSSAPLLRGSYFPFRQFLTTARRS